MTVKVSANMIKDKNDREQDWLEERISFEFFNLEEPGVPIKFCYGPTKKPENFTLLHGGKYNLPRKILRHIESRQNPIWSYKPNGNGIMEKTLDGYKSRFQCRQLFE